MRGGTSLSDADADVHRNGPEFNADLISILLVDDDEDFLFLVRDSLLRCGEFTVDTMTSAQKALKLPHTPAYDVIVSDYQMPGMDGIEFLKVVREKFGDIPFILFATRSGEEVLIDAINYGADYYIQKGVHQDAQFAELIHKIKQAVEKKRAKCSLIDSEKYIADIIHFLPDATFAIDHTGHVIAWNRAIEEMTGILSRDMLGKGEYEYAIPFYGFRRPSLIDMIDASDETIAHYYSHNYRTEHSLTAETDLSHPKGTRISTLVEVCRFYNKTGEIIGAIESIRDITELKKIEQKLRENQRMLAEAMDLAHLVNWEYDVIRDLFTFDERFYAMYGTTPEREGGNQMTSEAYAREFLHPADQELVAQEVENSINATDPDFISQVEHRIIRRDGEIRYISVRFGVTKDADGRTIQTHGANQDITEHKKAEEALKQANRQLNLLSSITRHDTLNMVAVLFLFLEKLEMECRDPVLCETYHKMLSATEIIQSHIEFTRVYADMSARESVWQSLDAILSGLHFPAHMTLSVDYEGISIFADPMLEKVFHNLLDNAIRHGQKVSEIRISAYQYKADLVIVWEDNGVGIPAEKKGHIFNKGFGENTGLGMFLAREILSLTGISILENGVPGKGARFEITVPNEGYRI